MYLLGSRGLLRDLCAIPDIICCKRKGMVAWVKFRDIICVQKQSTWCCRIYGSVCELWIPIFGHIWSVVEVKLWTLICSTKGNLNNDTVENGCEGFHADDDWDVASDDSGVEMRGEGTAALSDRIDRTVKYFTPTPEITWHVFLDDIWKFTSSILHSPGLSRILS